MPSPERDRLNNSTKADERVTVRVPDRLLNAVENSEYANRSTAIRAGLRAVLAGDVSPTEQPIGSVVDEVDAVADELDSSPEDVLLKALGHIRKRGGRSE